MKRISYNYAVQSITNRSNGWLHLNSSSGGYQLEQFSHQYETQINTLKTGGLREVWDYFEKLNKSKYEFLPKHCFPFEKPEQAAVWTLTHFVDKLNKTVENFKLTHKAFFHISESDLISSFIEYCAFFNLKVHDTSQTGTDHVFYNPDFFDGNLRPVIQQVTSGYTFAKTVKPLSDEDLAIYNALPIAIYTHDYDKAETKVLTRLYNTYVEPICPGIATTYKLKSDITNRGKGPDLAQSMHQTLRWVVEYQEKGEMSYEVAAGFFFSHLDATAPIREFFQKFYVQK